MTEIYGGALPDNAAAAAMPDMLSSGTGGGLMAALGEGFAHAFPTLELNRALAESVATTGIDPSTGLAIPAIQEAPQLSPEEATEQYGIEGALRFDSPVPASVAAEMNDRKHEELARQDIINRSPIGGVARTAAQFAGGLPGIADPLMIASGFIPAVPAARAAIMGASLGGRLALGAIQGAVAGAALTPVFYGLAKQDQEDYGAVDALLNIALGGVAGGVGHGVFGREAGLRGMTGGPGDALAHANPEAMVDIATASPETHEALLRGAVSALVDDRPVDLPPELLPPTTPGARPYDRLPAEPMRLASWLRQQGGVIDEGGELAAMDAGRQRPGLINQAGMSPDAAAEAAWQEGYLQGNDIGSGAPSPSELIDALARDLHGNPVYSDQDELQRIAHQDALGRNAEVDRYAQDFGISTEDKTRAQFWDEVADHLSQEDLAREIASHDEAESEAYTRFEQAAEAEGWQDREAGPARTLEEMEDAHRQEEIANGPREIAAGDRGPDIDRLDQGIGEGGVGSRGRGAGARPSEPGEAEPGRPGTAGEIADPLDDIAAENAIIEQELRQARGEDEEEPAELTAANEALQEEEGRAKAIEQAGACLARRS